MNNILNKMHCGTCSKKFSLMRTRKQCSECRRYYCKYCVMRKANKNIICENCAVLTSRPLNKMQLLKLKARDLQLFLANRQVSTRGCIEKEDLVNLVLTHVDNGSTDFQQSNTSNNESNSTSSHLFKNLRSFFSSTPDVSTDHLRTNNSEFNRDNMPFSSQSNSPTTNPTSYFQARTSPFYNSDIEIEQAEEATSSSFYNNGHSSNTLRMQPSTSNSDQSVINTTLDNRTLSPSEQNNFGKCESNTSISNTESFQNLLLSDIESLADLNELSIQQLKFLLMRNRVDFKGCVEKSELLEKVRRLWTEHSQSRQVLENLPLDDLCKICMDAPIECVMLECGHMATCTSCGKVLSECPICRQYVVRVVRTFRV